MPIVYESASKGGGSGTVTSVTAGDTSIVVGGTATDPTVKTNTLDVIAADHPAAADWSNNSHKITSLANGAAAQDAAAFGQIPTALPPNGAAGGDLAGTYPNPTVGNVSLLTTKGDILWESANGTAARLGVGSQNQVLAVGASSAIAWATPPGFEIGYDQVTSGNIDVTGTTEGTATTLITCAAHTFDGSPIMVWLYIPAARPPSGAITQQTIVGLFESGTLIDRLAQTGAATTNNPNPFSTLMGAIRITPSAASHSYIVAAWATSTTGTPRVACGTGGPGNNNPMFVRFTKV